MTTISATWQGLTGARLGTRLSAVLLLCAATAAVFASGFRYEIVRPGIVPGITAGGWGATPSGVRVTRAEPPVVTLTGRVGPRFPLVITFLRDPQQFRLVRVSAELAARDLRSGAAHWQQGRILLVSLDGRGRRLRHLETEVGAVAGTADWRRVELVVPVEPETARFRLVVYNAGDSGRMMVRNLAVDAVAETPSFAFARVLLIALWVGIAVWALWPLLACRRWGVLPAATVALGVAILAGTLAPQPGLSNFLQPVKSQLAGFAVAVTAAFDRMADRGGETPGAETEAGDDSAAVEQAGEAAPSGGRRRAGLAGGAGPDPAQLRMARLGLGKAPLLPHFTAFLLLGLVAAAAFPAATRRDVAAGLAVFAIAGETLQMFSYTRSTELDDYGWNLAGIAAGVALVWLAQSAWRRSRPLPG